MPTYEYRCINGHRLEAIRPMRESALPIQCTVCFKEAPRIPSAPRVFGDFQGYVSPVSGRWVEGRRARNEDFARTGWRAYEPGEKEIAAKAREANDRKFDAVIDEAVERTAAELHIS